MLKIEKIQTKWRYQKLSRVKNKVILVFPGPMNTVYWLALYASCESLITEITWLKKMKNNLGIVVENRSILMIFPLVKFSVSHCWMSPSPKWEWTARPSTFSFLSILYGGVFHVGVMVSSFTSIRFSWFMAEKIICALNGHAWECSAYINRSSA